MASNAHVEVIWFDISMNEAFGMDVLNPSNHLISKHQNSLDSESLRAKVEQIFQ